MLGVQRQTSLPFFFRDNKMMFLFGVGSQGRDAWPLLHHFRVYLRE